MAPSDEITWKITGGKECGIIVRQDRHLGSPQLVWRLTHGSIVKELDFSDVEGRLEYELVSGSGPQTGWISVNMKGKTLAKRTSEVDAEPKEEVIPEGMTVEQFRITKRCKKEAKKKIAPWKTITNDQVINNHMKKAPGMCYNMDFPWTEEMLHSRSYGAAWLTKAFHKAGTLPKDNRVVRIITDDFKITTGNNGGKFLFEVQYQKPDEALHTKLFAKIPHSMDKETSQDRLSSSVNKQPQELYEINASRLLEASLPMKIPRFYFGDISNETSNFVLITEAVPFAKPDPLDFAGETRSDPKVHLGPFEIEGPYDKCMDWTLRGEPREYYLALTRAGALMAGRAKAGAFGNPELLVKSFDSVDHMTEEMWNMHSGITGQPLNQLKPKLKMATEFMGDIGKVVFPDFCQQKPFQEKFQATLKLLNAYMAEANYWCHSDPDYIALGHSNMNVDNAYFWRNESGELELGVFDWGGLGSRCVGNKLWWWLYCGEFDGMNGGIDAYLECFVDAYLEGGGPRIDKEVLRMQFVIGALSQMFGLCAAVGQIYRMCPQKEWPTIKDRFDERVGLNIHGKSTLRLYLQVMSTIVSIIEVWKADKMLEDWVNDFCTKRNTPKKGQETME